MPLLHDPATTSSIESRLNALRADARPRWGKMSVGQMLWHVNQALADSLGDITAPANKLPLPAPLIRFITLKLPWPKGAPTNPGFVAKSEHDFGTEHARCLQLVGRFTKRPIDQSGANHSTFGRMTGRQVSELQAKHLNHHLTQFGV